MGHRGTGQHVGWRPPVVCLLLIWGYCLFGPLRADDRVILHYDFDDGNGDAATDLSGNELHAPILGATLVSQGGGLALSLDGSDDCIDVPQSPLLDELGKPGLSYSVELWFRSTGKQHQSLTEKWIGPPYPWALRGPDATGLVAFALYDGKDAAVAQCRDAAFLDGEWHHLAGIRNAEENTVQLYVDGESRARVGNRLGDVSNTGPVAFGRRNAPSSGKKLYPDYCFEGFIDDIRILAGALSSEEVGASFAARAGSKGIVRDVTEVRTVRRAVDLSGSVRPLVVLRPPDDAYAAAAVKLSAGLEELLGVRPKTTVRPEEALPDACNTVVIGNVNTNELFARLYFNYYAYANSLYPGDGGYILRTVFEPYPWSGKGDVVAIGCSDATGAARGVDALLERVSVASKSLPYTLAVSAIRPLAEVRRSVGYALHIVSPLHGLNSPDAMPPTFEAFDALARQYLKSGDEQVADWAVDTLERVCSRYAQYEGRGRALHEAGYGGTFLAVWDAFEEYPGLTDTQRLHVTQALLTQYRAQVEETKAYDWARIGRNDLLTWNHTTFPLLGVYYGARYFHRFYGLTEAKTGLRKARQCFLAQARSWKPEEDADTYIGHTMEHTQAYLLGEWAMDFFADGVNEAYTDYYVGICDSAGMNSGFGDSSYGRDPSLAMCALPLTFWHTRDGRYLWLIRHYLGDQWQNPFHRDTVPVADTSHVGMRVFPMDPQLYEHTRVRSSYGEPLSPPNIPLEAAFDKVSFRESWDPNGQYLLLDGFARGKHLHYDGNAINVFVDRGKRWLIDHDYLARNTTEHSMITVVRDGRVKDLEPSCAGIVTAGQGTGLAMLTTEVRDYGGTDWRRAIFWSKGDYFVCMDRVEAREAGEFAVSVTWKLEQLGAEQVVEPRAFRAVRSELSTVSRDVYVVADGSASGGRAVVFPTTGSVWAAAVDLPPGTYGIHIVGYGLDGSSDSLYAMARGMEQAEFHLSKGAYGHSTSEYGKPGSTATVRVENGGPQPFRFWMRENPPVRIDRLVFTGADGKPVLELEAEDATQPGLADREAGPADRFWLRWADAVDTRVERYTTRGISVALCKLWQQRSARLQPGDEIEVANVFYTDDATAPVAVDLRRVAPGMVLLTGDSTRLFAVGGAAIEGLGSDTDMLTLLPDRVAWVGGTFVQLGNTRLDAPGGDYNERRLTGEARRVATRILDQLASRTGDKATGRETEDRPPVVAPAWTFGGETGARISRLRTADLNGDGQEEILLATGTRALVLGADGRQKWAFDLNGLCHDVRAGEALEDYPGLEVVVAGGDCQLYLLDSTGQLLRQVEMRDTPRGRSHGTALFEVLTAAIFNTDGKPRIFAANSRFDVVTFDSKLKQLARAVYSAQHGGIDLWALDVSGDGRKEVFCTDHYGHLQVVAHDGEGIRGYYTSIGDMVADFGDLNGDGLIEAVFGSTTGDVMAASFTHAKPWKGQYKDPWWWRNVGCPVNRIRIADLDRDGIGEVLIASGTGYLYVLDAKGKEKWRHRAQANVADVVVLDGNDRRIALIDSAGTITTMDHRGEAPWTRRLEGEPRILATCQDVLVVALENTLVAVPIQ